MNILVWVFDFVKQHWLKVILICILLVVVFKREISLGIHFKTPYRPDATKEQMQPIPIQEKRENKGYFTEEIQPTQKRTSLIERFSNFPILGSKKHSILSTLDQSEIDDFLNRFTKIAQVEHEQYDIPTSIILANALLHSEAGTIALAKEQYNYFALPCSANWRGASHWKAGNCYRQYEKAWTSFRDHSLYLTTGPNTSLVALGNDYEEWAAAIEALNYSPTPQLSRQLIEIIETLNLQQLDVE